MNSYTEQELRDLFFDALDLFNDCLDTDISEANTILAFFTPASGKRVYEQFCRKYFPKKLRENYKAKGYFHSFAAQAFIGDGQYGVMIRSDLHYPVNEIKFIFLHEISHLFCTTNEIEGGGFYDRYCMSSGIEDGMMNAGYAIWREAVASILADSVWSEYADRTIADVKEEISNLYDALSPSNPDSKEYMSRIIVNIMLTAEVSGTLDWAVAEEKLRTRLGIKDERLYSIIKMAFDNIHQSPFWTITPQFILDLGEVYLALLSFKLLRGNLSL